MKLATALLLAIGVLFSNPAMSAPEDDVKALFERFVAAQNAHDANAVRDLLLDSPNFLWITRGTTIWGRDAAMKRFETLYQGTWRLAPDSSSLKIIMLGDNTAQLYASILYASIIGQPAISVQLQRRHTEIRIRDLARHTFPLTPTTRVYYVLAFDVVCSGCAQPCLRTVILALVVERSVRPSPRLDRFVPLFRTMVHADIVIGLACPLRMSFDASCVIIAT